jgi:hypothetical protein
MTAYSEPSLSAGMVQKGARAMVGRADLDQAHLFHQRVQLLGRPG